MIGRTFPLDSGGLARVFVQKSSYEYVEIYLHPPGIGKTQGVADGRWGSSVALCVSRGFLRPYSSRQTRARCPKRSLGS